MITGVSVGLESAVYSALLIGAAVYVGLQGHVARAVFMPRVPVHVTMRAMKGVPRMRAQSVAPDHAVIE